MINILLEGFDIDAPWLYDELKNYIKPNLSVAVVAFSFRDNRVKSLSDWNALYAKGCGKYHDGIVGGFTAYGIPEENMSFINYFRSVYKELHADHETGAADNKTG